jgi:hypothetical protein
MRLLTPTHAVNIKTNRKETLFIKDGIKRVNGKYKEKI